MWYQRYKMKKVKAGVLLYALLMAAIFSLLLQFYLHRQVAERRILKTSQDRLRAYALVQLALEKRKSDEKTSEIHLKSGTVQLKKDNGFLLLHSTGTKPTNTEVDVPIVYADYYFIEALMRKNKLEKTGKLF